MFFVRMQVSKQVPLINQCMAHGGKDLGITSHTFAFIHASSGSA
jgi:hypothetical protein